MGFLDSIGDFLFGTQDEAAKLNQQNVDKALGLLGNVPISSLYGQAQGAVGQGRQDIMQGYQQALSRVGTAGVGSALAALQREREAQGMLRQTLMSRGLGSSSGAARMGSGIRGETDRTLAGIEGQVASAQGGLLPIFSARLAAEVCWPVMRSPSRTDFPRLASLASSQSTQTISACRWPAASGSDSNGPPVFVMVYCPMTWANTIGRFCKSMSLRRSRFQTAKRNKR